MIKDHKTKTCKFIDRAVPSDRNTSVKVTEKLSKYKDLEIETSRMWGMRTETIPVIIGALGAIKKGLETYLGRIPDQLSISELQKITLLGTAHILRRMLSRQDKTNKQVRVIEMSCPWLENRESKDFEKTTKYSKLRLELTNRYPEYKVNQYNIIMDVLGGCSKEVEKNIKELVGDKCESIMRQMQKAILSSSLHIARMFRLNA